MNLTSTRHAFMSAYLKGEESRAVTAEQIEEMLQRSSTIQDALEIIGETDIGEYLLDQPIKTFVDADNFLWMYLGECLEHIEGFAMSRDMSGMARLYVEKYDVLNVRAALRILQRMMPSSMIPIGKMYRGGRLQDLSTLREKDELISILVACDLASYIPAVENINEKDAHSVSEGEVVLQNLYHEKVLKAFRGMGDGYLLEQAFTVGIDMANLRTVFRMSLGEGRRPAGTMILSGGRMISEGTVQELLTMKIAETTGKLEDTGYQHMAQEIAKEYEKSLDITVIDTVMEKHGFRMLRDILSPRILSPATMLWYLLIKELEIRNLRLIFKMLTDRIPPAEIKDLVIAA